MTSKKLTLARLGKAHVAAVLASSALFTAGCANMATTATSTPLSSGAAMTGRVHGGNNSVANSTVDLYIVGTSGLGSSGALLAQTVTSNDGTGSFRFTKNPGNVGTLPTNPGSSYQCPTGSDALLYILATGGNTTGNTSIVGANNTSAAFLAPVGYCSQVTNATYVDVSEVTTVATVAAAAQFINPTNDSIGNDGIGVAYQAIGAAFKTIPNLVNAATGAANTTTTIAGSGTGVSGVTMTVTAPTTTLNTIADILAACINQQQPSPAGGTSCSTLFANTQPPQSAARESQPTATYNTAIDTVQAALYMFLNPTDGGAARRNNLFGLVAASGAPFQPTLTAAPSDWILPITYSTNSTCGSGSSFYFARPYGLGIDVNGNIWIGNKATTNGSLVEMTAWGAPETCVTLGGSNSGVVVDSGPGNTVGNIWYVDNANSLIWVYPPSGGASRSYASPAPPLAITADGNGNIFFTTESAGGVGSVYEILSGSTNSPLLVTGATVGPNPATIFPDSAEDIWVTSGAGYVTELQQTTNVGNIHGYLATQYSVVGPTYGLITGPASSANSGPNRVYITSDDTNSTFTILAPTTSAYTTLLSSSANLGGTSNPTGLWIDGAQTSWIGNNSAETSGQYSVSEIGPDGGSLSPAGTNGGFQFASPILNQARTTVVDSVGNVWVLNDGNANSVTQLVGAAVPVYQPYSLGISKLLFQVIP